jgi:hypothetical protein
MRRVDIGLGSLLAALALSGAILAGRRTMWLDEVFSYVILTQPTLDRAYELSGHVIGTVPLYPIVAWFWHRLFAGEYALRMLSVLMTCAALALVYLRLRTLYARISVFVGVGTAFLLSELVLAHNVEIRFYGLYLLFGAALFYGFGWLAEAGTALLPRFLVLYAVTALWTFEHVLAVYYTGAAMAALAFVHLLRRGFRPLLYLAVPLGWATVALLWHAQVAFQLGTHDGYFVARPPIITLFSYTGAYLNPMFLSLLMLAGATFALDLVNHGRTVEVRHSVDPDCLRLLVVSFAFLLVPILAFVMARVTVPVFEPRYYLPSLIGLAMLFTHWSEHWILPRVGSKRAWAVMAVYGALLMAAPFAQAFLYTPNRQGGEDARFAPDLPMVVEELNDFVPRSFYAGDGNRYVFVVDPDVAKLPGNHSAAPIEWLYAVDLNKLMPQRFNAMRYAEFARGHDDFLVLHSPRFLWFETHYLANPEYKVSYLGPARGFGGWADRFVYRVQRSTGSPPSAR